MLKKTQIIQGLLTSLSKLSDTFFLDIVLTWKLYTISVKISSGRVIIVFLYPSGMSKEQFIIINVLANYKLVSPLKCIFSGQHAL